MSLDSKACLLLMLLVVFQMFSCASSECSGSIPIEPCNGTNFTQIAEYVLQPNTINHSVCFSSNTSIVYSVSSAAAVHIQNASTVVQYCSNTTLNPTLVCSSNQSMHFSGTHVLFVSLDELASTVVNEFVHIRAIDANGSDVGQFNLGYVPAGIYPRSDSPVTVMANQSLSLEWISYDGPLNLSFVDFDNMAASTQTLTSQIPVPSCVEPSDTFSFRPAVPMIASFVINPASAELSGTYTVSSSNGFSSSIKLAVEINGLPVLESLNGNVIRQQINSLAEISCSIEHVESRPSWYFNNVPIEGNDGQYTLRRRKLQIANLDITSGGWYTCATSNTFGSAYKDFLLIPTDTPAIVVKSVLPSNTSLVIASGSSLVLACTTTGLPPPTIRWYKDNEEIINGSGQVFIDSISGALVISNYTADQKPTNGYNCIASNTVGEAQGTLINVEVKEYDSSSNYSEIHNIVPNQSILLECPLYSINNSVYTWYKNGMALLNSITNLTETMENITVVGDSDGSTGGVYCCQVVAGQQVADTRCYVVNTQLPASLSANNLVYSSIQLGRNISFFVATETANNVDKSRLHWYRNDSLINNTNDGRVNVYEGVQTLTTLSIYESQPSDTGRYSVKGSTSSDDFNVDFELVVTNSSCENNLINSFNGEGSRVMNDWSGLEDSSHAFLSSSSSQTAENHFTLNPDESVPQPRITQMVSVSTDGEGPHTAKISCRMRSDTPRVMLPQVMITNQSSNSTLLLMNLFNDTQEAWQWVTMEAPVTTGNFSVSLIVNRTNSSSFQGSVYFDDLCFAVISKNVMPTSSTSSVPTLPTSTPSATPTIPPTTPSVLDEIIRYLDEYKYMIVIPVGSVLIIMLLCCCVCCMYCCCCRKKKASKKSGRRKSPLLAELNKSLEGKTDTIEMTPAEKQSTLPGVPVYIEPGVNGTAIYLDHSQPPSDTASPDSTSSNRGRVLSASYDYPGKFLSGGVKVGGRDRLSSTPYDYPSLSRSVGKGSSTSPILTEQYDYANSPNLRQGKLSREQSPLPSTPTIAATNGNFNRSPRASEGEIHIPSGNVRKISDIFEKKKVEPTLSDEENPYDVCRLSIGPSSPWSKDSSFLQKQPSNSLSPHDQPSSPNQISILSPEDTSNIEETYDVCVLKTPPLPTEDPYTSISSSAKKLPLPSVPEKGKDSGGYLVVLDKKDKVQENPYNTIDSPYDDPEGSHTQNRQSKPSITHSHDGYLLVVDKKEQVEDETYDKPDRSGVNSSSNSDEYEYCQVNTNNENTEDNYDTYVVPSLEDKSNDQEESIYY